jgi:tRNA 2-selenouridine synthase
MTSPSIQLSQLSIESCSVEEVVKRSSSQNIPLIDVRTPAEFAQGHIPEAINLPLFSNEERAKVGTAYKQQSRNDAILLGLDLVGGKMRSLAEAAQRIAQTRATQTVVVYCWRGGMRSSSVAWLLNLCGLHVITLRGGYKAFRRYVLESFLLSPSVEQSLTVLGGLTGSGKTQFLRALGEQGETVIDLEALAHHKGSAFGSLGQPAQPTQEQFENRLALVWRAALSSPRIWIEDESQHIGRCVLPRPLWQQMRSAPVIALHVEFHKRCNRILQEYGMFAAEALRESIITIQKRLGGLQTQQALDAVQHNDLKTAITVVLQYYDSAYRFGLSKREPTTIHVLNLNKDNPTLAAQDILEYRLRLFS